jgi:tRNA G10  N-methylase Trm11
MKFVSLPKPYFEDEFSVIYNCKNELILPHLGRFDLLLTDPPFGIGFAAQPTTGGRRRNQSKETWDDEPGSVIPFLALTELQIIWGGNYFPLPQSRGWLSWFKPDAPPSMGHFELAWTNMDMITRQISCSIAATNKERIGHPNQKPLNVMSGCLNFAPNAKTVLDPYLGSGTTAVACKQRGIHCVGIEQDERYCAVAVERLRQNYLITA